MRAEEKITISKTILDYVIQKNEGVLTSDARQDDRWNPAASIVQAGIREAICVPMQARYDVVGAIYIDTSTSPQEVIRQGGAAKFTEDHLKLMIAIAHQAALAVEDTRYYSAMVQAERLAAVGQTVATLSHHIKNILQGIRGGSYLIELGLKEHDESVMGKGWKIVDKNQNKISALVMDMLTFSKEREPDLTTANVNQTVADVIELSQVQAAEASVELHYEPAAEMPDLVFDPEGLHRAVLNVVSNAVDAAGEVDPARPRGRAHGVCRAGRPSADRRAGHRPRHRARADAKTLQSLRLDEEGPRHRFGAAREPEDSQRARRPHPRTERARPRQPLHPRIAGRDAEHERQDGRALSDLVKGTGGRSRRRSQIFRRTLCETCVPSPFQGPRERGRPRGSRVTSGDAGRHVREPSPVPVCGL